jgi:hypothetical protein
MNDDFCRFLRFYTDNPFAGYAPFEIENPYEFLFGLRPKSGVVGRAIKKSEGAIKEVIKENIKQGGIK